MAITEAQVLSVVNDRLNRAETSISEELRWALYDISSRGNFLKATHSFSTVDGTAAYDKPDNFRENKAVVYQDSNDEWSEPLDIVSFRQYLKDKAGDSSTSEPDEYCIYGDSIYLYPTPDDAYTVNWYHTKFHDNDTTDIELPEIFREAVYNGTLFKVAEKFELQKPMQNHLQLYEGELAKRLQDESETEFPAIVEYKDL